MDGKAFLIACPASMARSFIIICGSRDLIIDNKSRKGEGAQLDVSLFLCFFLVRFGVQGDKKGSLLRPICFFVVCVCWTGRLFPFFFFCLFSFGVARACALLYYSERVCAIIPHGDISPRNAMRFH